MPYSIGATSHPRCSVTLRQLLPHRPPPTIPQFLPDGEALPGPVEIPFGPEPIMDGTAFTAHGAPYFPDQHQNGPTGIEEGDHA